MIVQCQYFIVIVCNVKTNIPGKIFGNNWFTTDNQLNPLILHGTDVLVLTCEARCRR